MKVRMSKTRIIIACLISILIAGGLIFGSCFRFFLNLPWGWQAYTLLSFWLVSSIVFFVLSLTQNYYVINKKNLVVHRFIKEIIYDYNNVVYINEELSVKKKMVCFYTKQGKTHFLTFDEKGLIYETMLKKCANRISKEEFEAKYQDVKW